MGIRRKSLPDMGKGETFALKAKANDYVRREKFEKALNIYRLLLEKTPNDTSVMLKIGNIYQSLGKESAAVAMYAEVAEYYYERKMYHQGIAVCRLIVNVDPLHILAQHQLVDMYIKVYGGLPRSKGDTIIPPRYMINPESETVEEVTEEEVKEAVAKSRDSWNPVDIIFSVEELKEIAEPLTEKEPSEEGVEFVSDDLQGDIEVTDKETMTLIDLPKIPLFESLSNEDLQRFVENAPVHHVDKNVFILKEGERGDSFFVILGGSVQVFKGEWMTPMARLSVGACFGEMALLGPGVRRASVLAVEPTVLLEIHDVEMHRVQILFPAVREKLMAYVRERLFANLMVTSSLFCHFSNKEHEALRKHFRLKTFEKRETVIKQGDDVHELSLIVDGQAEVLLDFPRRRRRLIRTMGIGEIFGEISLLTDAPSKVTVRAKDRLTVLCLSQKRFKDLIMHHPQILSLVSALLESAGPAPDAYF